MAASRNRPGAGAWRSPSCPRRPTASGAERPTSASPRRSSQCWRPSCVGQARSSSRFRLLEQAWDYEYENRSNVVDVYISYLREKIDRPFGVESIETIRGAGYRIRADGGIKRPALPLDTVAALQRDTVHELKRGQGEGGRGQLAVAGDRRQRQHPDDVAQEPSRGGEQGAEHRPASGYHPVRAPRGPGQQAGKSGAEAGNRKGAHSSAVDPREAGERGGEAVAGGHRTDRAPLDRAMREPASRRHRPPPRRSPALSGRPRPPAGGG